MANEQRLIDANVLKAEWTIASPEPYNTDAAEVLDSIDKAPTIDALPLRCHMGDTVWIVGTKCMSGLHDDECPDKNEWYSFDDFCEDCPIDREYIVFPRSVHASLFVAIHDLEESPLFRWGETVFKTQEEAEAALAKMKEADHEISV